MSKVVGGERRYKDVLNSSLFLFVLLSLTAFLPTSSSCPYRITAGPYGNLWVTEQSGNKIGQIGQITTTGVVTKFAVPKSVSGSTCIIRTADLPNETPYIGDRNGNCH